MIQGLLVVPTFTIGLVCGVFLLVLVLVIVNTTTSNASGGMPPGPGGLPIIGCLLKVGGFPFKAFYEWSKVYGSIITVKMGGDNWVVLNDYESIQQVRFVTILLFLFLNVHAPTNAVLFSDKVRIV